jgi:hypothetical protein
MGVLDEAYGQLTPLSGVAIQARKSTEAGKCSSYVAWRDGMATLLSGLSAPFTSSCHILAAKPSPVKSNSHEVHRVQVKVYS